MCMADHSRQSILRRAAGGATAGLAADRTIGGARGFGAHPHGPGTHRVRLVGWRRCALRLLPDPDPRRPTGLGLPSGGRGRPVVAARLVCMSVEYAELHCLSNFSFQRGASSALELFQRARQQGYQALAITDECTLAGIVRAWQAARSVELPLIIGSEIRIENGPKLVLLVESLEGYQNLCRLITRARRRTHKGQYQVVREDFSEALSGVLALWVPDTVDDVANGHWLKQTFAERLWLAVQLHCGQDDTRRLAALLTLAGELRIPAVASGDVHMHARGRRALQDTMTAIRHHLPVAEAGMRLHPNGERHLRSLEALGECYPPALLAETLTIARRCTFDLKQLRYEYPRELVPEGHTDRSEER